MSTVAGIKNILIEQISGYRLLLDLLRREREHLIKFSADGVEDLAKEKDTLVLKLRLLEEERFRLINKFTDENMITGDKTLQKIYEITGDNDFQTMRLQLISLLQSISELNGFNRILIERSLILAKNASKFLHSFGLTPRSNNLGDTFSMEA